MRSVRRMTLIFVPMLAAVGVCLLSVLAFGVWQRVSRYPRIIVAGSLGGLRVTTTALGRCLAFDQHFITGDALRDVYDWHTQHGWAEFVPLLPQGRVGPLAFGRFFYVDGSSRGTVVFERQAYCLALN